MDKYPMVYIVILNFNSYEETIECVGTVNKINYPNYEVVIVDNNSNDDSFSKLTELYSNYAVLQSGQNLGYANGNNIGIKYALKKGAEYICVLNNDVIVEEDFLSAIIKLMEADNSVGIAGPCICEYSNRDVIQAMGANISLYTGLTQGKNKGKNYFEVKADAIEVDYLGGACFVVRKDVFSQVGLIPENYFLFFEETEFCLNTKRAGYKLICLKGSRVYHKRSATISKFKGLSYYFLNRNRVVFMRRNANWLQRSIFSVYLFVEGIGRILVRREPIEVFKFYFEGNKADLNSIDLKKVETYLNK